MIRPDLLRRAPQCRKEPPPGYVWTPPPVNVVFTFCERDKEQAIRVLNWQAELCTQQPNELHLLTDEGVECDQLVSIAQGSWQKVHLHRIVPVAGKWPQGPNHAFVETCKIMAHLKKPWLLWEADAIPARKDWLQRLEYEYAEAKRPFAGPWMDHFDLVNGGGTIYPPDVLPWIPNFLKKPAVDQLAYDVVIAPEIVAFTHPMNHLSANYFYFRTNGRPGGMAENMPKWTKFAFDWAHTKDLCLLHRDKNGTTIEFLREKIL